MQASSRSVFVFSMYLFLLGGTLVAVPNLLLTLFSIPGTNEVWIRVVGMLVLIIAYYYQHAARLDLVAFHRATVHGRCAVLVFFVGFVVLGFAPPVLILFGAVDVAGAAWTLVCLRRERAA